MNRTTVLNKEPSNQNGGLKYLEEEAPDIFAIQEIKCATNKIPPEAKISGYHTYWYSAEKNGYSGVGLYSKIKPLNVSYGIKAKEHDREGRVITAEYSDYYFVTAYVPNAGQNLERLSYRETGWDPTLLAYIKTLNSTKPVILCGDLNVAHEEIDLANPTKNHKSAGFTDQERAGFGKLLEGADLVDTYRSLYPSRTGAYTFWSYRSLARPSNTGWRLDYFLTSKQLTSNVADHEIRCGVRGSDHCPVVLYMNF